MRWLVRVVFIALGFCGSVSAADAQWVQGSIRWNALPQGSNVGDCAGNCGAGCSSTNNPCGGPRQYWELEYLDGPNLTSQESGIYACDQGSGHVFIVNADFYEAMGKWTYHGWESTACLSHDAVCGWETFPLCVIWGGCTSEWNQTWSYNEYITGYQLSVVSYWGQYPGGCPGNMLPMY